MNTCNIQWAQVEKEKDTLKKIYLMTKKIMMFTNILVKQKSLNKPKLWQLKMNWNQHYIKV